MAHGVSDFPLLRLRAGMSTASLAFLTNMLKLKEETLVTKANNVKLALQSNLDSVNSHEEANRFRLRLYYRIQKYTCLVGKGQHSEEGWFIFSLRKIVGYLLLFKKIMVSPYIGQSLQFFFELRNILRNL